MVDFEELRRAYEAGDEGALHAAANACRKPGAEWVALPGWVLEALVERQVEHMRRLPGSGGKGRHAKWARQHRMDLIHLARYTEFTRAMQQKADGETKNQVAKRVAVALKDTPYHDGTITGDAILKSVELIEAERAKDPEGFRRRFTFRSPGWLLSKK